MTALSQLSITSIDKVLISIDKALNDEIVLGNGLKLYLAPDYNPEFHATVTGKVYSLPANPKKEDKAIINQLHVGDEIAFNYRVVISKEFKPNKESFQTIQNLNHAKVFLNNKKQKILVNALPYRGKVIWVGCLLDNRGNVIDGRQGNAREIEKWLAQFTFGNDAPFVYKNLLSYEATDVWQAEAINIYAKKTDEGTISLGDRVIMKSISIDVTSQVKVMNGIHLPDNSIMTEYNDLAKVVSGGERIGIKKDDTVLFDPLYVEKYNFFGSDYLLIKEKRVHVIW